MLRAAQAGPAMMGAVLMGTAPVPAFASTIDPEMAALPATQNRIDHDTDDDSGISGGITLVSDYRFRGVSNSDSDPAVQASLDYRTSQGLFAGIWASTIGESSGVDAPVELDIYAGYAGSSGALEYTLGITGYIFPGAGGASFGEVQAELRHPVGPFTASLLGSYAPKQRNLAVDNFAATLGLSAPITDTPLSLAVRAGFEDGFFTRKVDWQAEVAFVRGAFTLTAAYVDTNLRRSAPFGTFGGAGLIISLGVRK